MKLYIYDHCPFCVRARMIFGLKKLAVEQIVLFDDDIETQKNDRSKNVTYLTKRRWKLFT